MTRIIRGAPDALDRRPTRVYRLEEQHARARADALTTAAEQRAAEMLAEAEAEAAELRAAARAEGEAEAAGLLVDARRQGRAIIDAAEGELTELALEIARKVLGRELALDPDAVGAVVARCLAAAGARQRIVARVHPEDLARVEATLPRLRADAGAALLIAEADPTLARGDCVLETEAGQIDGRLETQLAAIGAALRDEDR